MHFSKGALIYASVPQILGGVGCHKISADKLGADDSKELYHFNFAVGQFVRLLAGVTPPKVTRVDVYESPWVEDAFTQKKADLERHGTPPDQIWVFHGTKTSGDVEAICSGGFKVGGQGVGVANGSAYGKGVYTATGPGTPMGYGQSSRSVILCKALPGTTGPQGVGDSWKPCNDWVIFREAAQLLPKYVVHF